MLKSKFLAGVLATLITIVVIVGLVVLMVLVFNLGPENKVLTYGLAFGSIALWGGLYSWLKPKPSADEQQKDEENPYDGDALPPRHS